MTTPNQPAPDGAYVLGGNELHYGQDISEQYAKELWAIPSPTPSNAITMFREALRMAPTGSLDAVAAMIPGANSEDSSNPDDTTGDGIVNNLGETWLQKMWNSIVEAFDGDGQGGKTLTDAFNSFAGQKKETTQIAAGLAQLRADLTGNNNSGKTFQVDMSDFGTEIPDVLTKFHDSGVGDVVNDGDTLEYPNEDGRELFGYNVEPLLTDYPEVSLVVPRQAATYFGGFGNRALYWIFRANDDFSSFSFARLNGNKLKVGCVQAGLSTIDSPTWFGSGPAGAGATEVTIDPASYMTVAGGYLDDPRTIQFKVNNRVVATFYDSTEASAIDEVHRWTGLGIENDRNDLVNRVANVSHFMANDNNPTPVQGSGARMSRLLTSTVNVSGGTNAFPTSFFTFAHEKTEDIAVNLTNGGFIVSEGDWYTISVRVEIGALMPNRLGFCLFRNGLEDISFGPEFGYTSNAGGGTQLPGYVACSTPVYINAGDAVQIGYIASAVTPGAFKGDTTGNKTHLTISRGK